LIQLASKASLENPGQTPAVKFEDLQNFSQDIVCLSGPISGEIPYLILSGKSDEEIVFRIEEYRKIYGHENYFLEILYHPDIPKQELITKKLIELGQKYSIPLVF